METASWKMIVGFERESKWKFRVTGVRGVRGVSGHEEGKGASNTPSQLMDLDGRSDSAEVSGWDA